GSSGPGSVNRPCWNALRSVSSLRPRCSATSLRLQPTASNCCARAVTSGAILVDAANNAVLGDAEGSHDIDLAARTLADQLGRKHPKRVVIVLGVMKHRLSAAEVDPLI